MLLIIVISRYVLIMNYVNRQRVHRGCSRLLNHKNSFRDGWCSSSTFEPGQLQLAYLNYLVSGA